MAQAKHALTADENNTIQLFKKSTPAVVYITNLASKRDQFTMDMQEIPQGAGSGTIWDTEVLLCRRPYYPLSAINHACCYVQRSLMCWH